jgi:hypothetical protein
MPKEKRSYLIPSEISSCSTHSSAKSNTTDGEDNQEGFSIDLNPSAKKLALLEQRLAESEQQKRALAEENSNIKEDSKKGLQKGTSKSALGRNIDRLRKECGWSFDDLAHWSNIDKKTILSHVNAGKTAYPRTLKKYADTFTKKLGHSVKVDDLLQ